MVGHDRDQGSNAELRYFFPPSLANYSEIFSIDSYSGVITTIMELDREKNPEYHLTVIASDNGDVPRTASTEVHIVLVDYNDNPPVFPQQHYVAAG